MARLVATRSWIRISARRGQSLPGFMAIPTVAPVGKSNCGLLPQRGSTAGGTNRFARSKDANWPGQPPLAPNRPPDRIVREGPATHSQDACFPFWLIAARSAGNSEFLEIKTDATSRQIVGGPGDVAFKPQKTQSLGAGLSCLAKQVARPAVGAGPDRWNGRSWQRQRYGAAAVAVQRGGLKEQPCASKRPAILTGRSPISRS